MARLKKFKFNSTDYLFPVEDVKVGTTSVVTNGVANIDLSGKADDNAVVKLTGNQTIAGTKTFSTSPVVPSKTTDATNTGTAIATEAQVYKKQDKLTTQTAYTSKGSGTKVPQITTNTLGQVTNITEVNIDYPQIISDIAYGSSWDGDTTQAPSKNAVYDKISSMDTTISGKQDTLVSGTNIKTINNTSLLGSGNIDVAATVMTASEYSQVSNPVAGKIYFIKQS